MQAKIKEEGTEERETTVIRHCGPVRWHLGRLFEGPASALIRNPIESSEVVTSMELSNRSTKGVDFHGEMCKRQLLTQNESNH